MQDAARSFVSLIIALLLGAGAAAGPLSYDVEASTSLAFDADSARLELAQAETGRPEPAADPAVDPAPLVDVEAHPAFGKPGHWWWLVGGGYAWETNGDPPANDFNVVFTLSTFLFENFEFMMEFGGWYFDQPLDNAFGFNWSLIARWHIINEQSWTFFIEGGAGLLVSTDTVPDEGTGFNFTPRYGLGFTWRLGEGPGRLVTGVRWHHISNARIEGSDRNPSRDAIMGFFAFQFPF